MTSNKTGQLSIEFLLLAAAFLALLGLFVPVSKLLFDQSVFALDVLEASRFADWVEQKSGSLSALNSDGFFSVSVRPLGHWQVELSQDQLLVTVFSNSGLSKSLHRTLSLESIPVFLDISDSDLVWIQLRDNRLVIHR